MDNLPDAVRKTTGKKQYADTVALQFFWSKNSLRFKNLFCINI